MILVDELLPKARSLLNIRRGTNMPSDLKPTYQLDLDGPLFRNQRKLLLELIDHAHRGVPIHMDAEQAELLEGLLGLTDDIADQAHDLHGIDCLLES